MSMTGWRASSRRRAVLVVAAGLIASGIAAPAAVATDPSPVPPPSEPNRPQRTGRAIVLLERQPGPDRVGGVLERAGLRPEVSIPKAGAVAVEPPSRRGIAAVRSALRGEPSVAAVEPEYRRSPRLTPDDPAFSLPDSRAPLGDTYQWHLRKAGFERAWSRSTGVAATLAVIDSGIDGANPDFDGRVVAAVDRDDISGHGPATVDENGHGTHVAGLGCATADNGYGGASSSFGCRLIVAKSDLTDASIADSIIDSTDRGADVINMSFGGPGASQVIKNAIGYAWSHDVVMVAAASNDDETGQGVPARLLQPKRTGPRLRRGKGLVVTAAEFDGSRAWFKPGYGRGISLAAYGAASLSKPGIFSNFPSNPTELEMGIPFVAPPCQCRTSFEGDRRFAYLEGTSVAAPQVAGAAALIRSRKPGIKAKRALRILKRKARGRRFRGKLGWGILNAGAALRAAAG